MPKLTLTIPHALGGAQAAERLKGFLGQIKERYQSQVSNLEEQWDDNTLNFGFSTYGFPIKGSITIQDADVTLDGDLPFAAMMFKGKIEQEVRDQLTKLLA